ncbi:MAG: DUF4230 domain-containing protein [Dehalococcoidia bacterium]
MIEFEPRPEVSEPGKLPRVSPVPRSRGVWSIVKAVLVGCTLLSVLAVVGAGVATWHWVDHNVLSTGLTAGRTQTLNQAELLDRVRAFQLVTVKQTYAGQTHRNVAEVLNAGSRHIPLPGLLAGQQLSAKGRVTVTAGVDLAKVGPDDMQVMRKGKDATVLIHVPGAQVMSAELQPNTLSMSTSAGLLTQIGQALGLSKETMRNRAADEVVGVARDSAQQQGILNDASQETEHRLQAFLQSLPQNGSGHVTYVVVSR